MSQDTLNPYAAPATDVAAEPPRPESWKAIAWRWEKLRVIYNICVGLCGIPAVLATPLLPFFVIAAVAGTLLYGVAANVCYLLGPITEMYLNWFADYIEGRLKPDALTRFLRGRWPFILLWLTGTIGSMVLTLLISLAYAFVKTVPFQD